ncbi:MAG: Linoleoyl-CoA desaturase [Cytophagaceae bacterium]|nr:Linoleoyl-CoA desaturase [Cytophagaceae bacterium]
MKKIERVKSSPLRFVDKDGSAKLFFPTVRQRVDSYFKENNLSKHYDSTMVIKTITLLSAYLLPFIAILLFQPAFGLSLILWIIMGLGVAGIGMSVMHDANHGAYSSNSYVSYWIGHTLNLIGGSVFNWKLQHNLLHHTYTNIVDHDDDIADKLVLRFSPHTTVKWYHKLQFVYAFLFYGILTLYWTLLKDFIQFAKYTKSGINKNSSSENTISIIKILVSKLVYFFIILVVPVVFFHIPFLQVLSGFLLMHFIAGLVLTVVFQLAHSVEGTSHPLPNADGNIENAWAVHQMHTTVNFSRHNKFLCWYLGGLNFQIEHHLFPNICHVHYPRIAGIVKSTAGEFGIPYLEKKTFAEAVISHIRTLRRFGNIPTLNDALS